LRTYNESFAFSTWLFTIAYRLCLNQLRRKKALSGETDFSRVAGEEDGTPHRLALSEEARQLRSEVWSAVDQLTPAQRSAVLLFYREGMSCQDIGRVMNTPAVTVKSHLHRAREKLRGLLSGTSIGGLYDAEDDAEAEPRRFGT
jgi:RNA polymerase sigma-70 factor (ECF subfamily)